MQKENALFWPSQFDAQSELFPSRRETPDLGPEEIDHEMSFPKRKDRMKLSWLSQEGLEHFVRQYGADYEVLWLSACPKIRDLSPLGDLPGLKAVKLDYLRSADRLWDMSGNESLKMLSISDCKKLAQAPRMLQSAKGLEEVRLWGPVSGGTYTLESMEYFRDMHSLRRIDLNWIKLVDKGMDVLDTLPDLEEFHFDPGMLTTEEIAQIVAKHPNLVGDSLRAYDDEYMHIGEVRICGFRKPTLSLPRGQKRLEQYVREFEALVEKYRNM